MTAQESLTAALTGLLNNGDAPPCRANKATLNRWTSDDPDERQWAVWRCAPCTILDACHAAADETPERFGVWGGIDRTQTQRRAERGPTQ